MQVLIPHPPKRKNKDRPGRPRTDDRKAMNGIFYVLRTGCQWNALPKSLAASTVHDRFQEWRGAGVFEKVWKEDLLEYDVKKEFEWEWQSVDTVMTKAPLGGKTRARIRPTARNQGRSAACLSKGTECPSP